VLLYTDGLVERRDESLDVGLARLAAAAAGLPAGDLDASTVDALLAAMVPDGSRDDIAVLLHRVGR
jgi:serine phosphatase RsbU (regulator of sigma subunit)